MSGVPKLVWCFFAAAILRSPGLPAVEGAAMLEVAHASARIGDDDPLEIETLRRTHNLELVFALQGSGAYLADVRVSIRTAAGQTVLAAVSSGPFFFARLPTGQYRIEAEFNGKLHSKSVNVTSGGRRDVHFYWESE
ncbi:MAG: carboxypeptidase regulatory-like domain-containing protein [Candidatus Accumulibacter sp.]|uniref:carboxypeptidase-like regulatory domain-containing protein n=1 Tax=Accumulibacter sp. TaxID=2053492 RepID=UPI001A408FC2|nr:carboxypeptidase-like regulatory domain-containing protein [Accumulibacter sp.]MBL8395550.1 carboxypeptidase regulatory-like domain-containing protein [Accumulibacter sp.]